MSPCPGISVHSWVIWPHPCALWFRSVGDDCFLPLTSCIFMTSCEPKNCVSRYFIVRPPPPEDCFLLYFSHQKRHGPTISSQRLKKHDIFLFLLFMLLLQQQAEPAKCALGSMALPWPLPGNSKVPVGSSRSWYWALPLSLSHLSIRSLKVGCSLRRNQS